LKAVFHRQSVQASLGPILVLIKSMSTSKSGFIFVQFLGGFSSGCFLATFFPHLDKCHRFHISLAFNIHEVSKMANLSINE